MKKIEEKKEKEEAYNDDEDDDDDDDDSEEDKSLDKEIHVNIEPIVQAPIHVHEETPIYPAYAKHDALIADGVNFLKMLRISRKCKMH